MFFIGLGVGLVIGTYIGLFIMAACVLIKDSDKGEK